MKKKSSDLKRKSSICLYSITTRQYICSCDMIWSLASKDTHTGHTRVLLQQALMHLERKIISFWLGGLEHRKLSPFKTHKSGWRRDSPWLAAHYQPRWRATGQAGHKEWRNTPAHTKTNYLSVRTPDMIAREAPYIYLLFSTEIGSKE